MRPRRSVVPLSGALLAGLAIWGGPADAERPDARAAKVKITKIKIIVGRSRNALVGNVSSHNIGCVGGDGPGFSW
jgi:hypothetical protein